MRASRGPNDAATGPYRSGRAIYRIRRNGRRTNNDKGPEKIIFIPN